MPILYACKIFIKLFAFEGPVLVKIKAKMHE